MEMNNTGEDGSRPKFVEALESKYACLFKPSSAPRQFNDPERMYLTPLIVYGNKEVNDDEPLPSSFLKLLEDQNIIDPHTIKKKITRALSNMSYRNPHVLAQFWSPGIFKKRCVLTTLDQPFGLGVVDEALYSYRLKSDQCMFVVDGEHQEELGPPGRVYRQKMPEWSLGAHTLPDTTLGYINLPVFEPDSISCVGVLEIITSSNHDDYTFEVQEVSKALKEEDLMCPKLFEDYSFYSQVGDERQNELVGIFDALKSTCNAHNIPLIQTWALCGYSSFVANSGKLEQSCSSFNRKCIGKVCMSTYGLPYYVLNSKMWGFHEACRERHLDKSQGVVGRSLSSRGICFCEDVTKFVEDEYPLGSSAHAHGITSCLAIYLKSIERDVEYVIELVLPPDNINKAYLESLVETLKRHIKNVSGVKLGNMPLDVDPHWNLKSPPAPKTLSTKEEVLKEPGNHQPLVKNEVIDVTDSEDQSMEHMEDDQLENEPMDNAAAGTSRRLVPCLDVGIEDVDSNKGKKGRQNYKDKSKKPSKKRKTSEISYSLEEIRKHFEMKIDVAAAKLDVTKKRLQEICRGFGIKRWPYKKAKMDSRLKSNQTDAVIHTSEAANTWKQITIKATFKGKILMFPFGLHNGFTKLQKLVAEGFQLGVESFTLKYEDKDGDTILVACDQDLTMAADESDLMGSVSSSTQPDDQTVIRLTVVTRCSLEP